MDDGGGDGFVGSFGLCDAVVEAGTGDVDDVISFDDPDCPSGLMGAGFTIGGNDGANNRGDSLRGSGDIDSSDGVCGRSFFILTSVSMASFSLRL